MHPPQRRRPVTTRPDRLGELVEERPHRLHAPGLDIGDAHAVDTRGATVGRHVAPRSPHHVAAGDLVEERMEPTLRILLGTAVQHALQGTNGVQAISPSDGPSRQRGTHQRPSRHRRASVK
jgi:hypothetical protein